MDKYEYKKLEQIKNIETGKTNGYTAVISSNLTMNIIEEETNNVLISSSQILPFKEDDNLTINDKYYEVWFTDFNYDKGIFEVIVTET